MQRSPPPGSFVQRSPPIHVGYVSHPGSFQTAPSGSFVQREHVSSLGYTDVDMVHREMTGGMPMYQGYEDQFVAPHVVEDVPLPYVEPEPEPEPEYIEPVRKPTRAQRTAPKPEPVYVDKVVEKYVDDIKYVEVEVPVEKITYVDVPVYVDKIVERKVEVPVEVEKRVEVPVPYEKIVHVEVPVERIIYREVPVPVYGEEKVVVKEVTVPVEVIREVAVPVEHVVTKEVSVPVEIGHRSETRIGETRMVIGEETRASAGLTADHMRSTVPFTGPTSVGNVSGVAGNNTSGTMTSPTHGAEN